MLKLARGVCFCVETLHSHRKLSVGLNFEILVCTNLPTNSIFEKKNRIMLYNVTLA